MRAPTPDGRPPGRDRFAVGIAACAVVGAAVRIAAAATRGDPKGLLTDEIYYSLEAKQLAQDHWFNDPFRLAFQGQAVPSAAHPPLFSLYLSLYARLGLDTQASQRMVTCLTGVITVVVVGIVGRRLAGARVGLIAAAIAAIYPSLWATERQGLSEGLAALLAVGVLFAADRWRTRPTTRGAALIGAMIALLALTRAEYVLLFVVLAVPLVAFKRGLDRGSKLRALAAIALTGALVLAPWVGYNLSRFHEPVTMTTNTGVTIAATYCDDMFYGPLKGFWSISCLDRAGHKTQPRRRVTEDESQVDKRLTKYVITYANHHLADMPIVIAARVRRLFQLYRVSSSVQVDAIEGTGSPDLIRGVLWGWWALLGCMVGGLIVSWRRRLPVFPIAGILTVTTITAALVYGEQRFRVPAEPGCILLAAIGVDALWRWLSRRRSHNAPRAGEEAPTAA